MSRIVFTNANMLDGERPAQPGATVVLDGDRIVSVAEGTALNGVGPVDLGPDHQLLRLPAAIW